MSHTFSAAPLVAVTATTRQTEGALRVRLNDSYVRALEGAGLVPLIVPPLDPAQAPRVLAAVQGLVLTGGEDIAPHRFGAEPHPRLGTVHEARDAWELALVAEAQAQGMPTLAICRGVQLLNVALGGTLVQDLGSERPSAVPHERSDARTERVHPVDVEPHSRLAEALEGTRIAVNSIHHQALDRIAAGLRVSARAPDGVVEGVEWTDGGWWALGVQWHPEEFADQPGSWDRALFMRFARELRRERGRE